MATIASTGPIGQQQQQQQHSTTENDSGHEVLKFYIFGHNICHSLSPAMHNAGFKETGFSGFYSIHESPEVDESVRDLMRRPDFGGASVTFPHKLQIGRLLDHVSEPGKSVGAINTVIAKKSDGGKTLLYGENTDWMGIMPCITSASLPNLDASPAIVLGAGGAARAACYALQQLNVPEIFIVNRTRANAERMVSHFPKTLAFKVYDSLDEAAGVSDNLLTA